MVWAKKDVPKGFFRGLDAAVADKYGEIMLWAQRLPHVFDAAKAKFAGGADGWLVAFAVVHDAIVVTNEQPAPESRREIKLPDVCTQFGVDYCDAFRMLRDLSVQFVFEQEP